MEKTYENAKFYCKKLLRKYKVLMYLSLILSIVFTISSIISFFIITKDITNTYLIVFLILVTLGILTSISTLLLYKKVNALEKINSSLK